MPRSRKRAPAVDPRAARTRQLLALDATNVMRRLAARQEEMIALFSRLRNRAPLLQTLESWFDSVAFGDLAALETFELAPVNAFYASLAELRWYLSYTEDMPLTVQKTVERHRRLLEGAYAKLVSTLGAPVGESGPVVDAEVVEPQRPTRPALPSGGAPRRGR